MENPLDRMAHLANCDSLVRLTNRLMPGTSREKEELLQVIEAYRRQPALLQYMEQLEDAIYSLIHTFFEEDATNYRG